MRTRLSQFLEAVTVTAPSAIKELASKLAVYANDAAYESALGAGAEGDIYFNSTIQMIRLYKNAAWENFAADEIDYDNTTSGLSATTVQAAIDELESILSAHIASTSAHGIAGGVVMGTEGSTLDTVNFGIADDASTGTDLNITPTKIMTRMTAVASGDTLAGITNTNTNFLTLINDSTFPLSILNDSTGEATPAYRILTGTGSNLSLAAGSSLLLKYDPTESRWRVIGGSGAGISDPMTTRGDLIYRNPSNTTARLATGLFGQLLGTDGTDTWWENPKEFNYIGNPDALHNDTDYITTSTAGTLTVAQTTTASQCPEDPLKATAWRISGSGLTAGDYIEFQAAKVIANSHSGRMGRGVLHVRDVTSGQVTARAYNKTTSTYIGQSVALDIDRDYSFDVPLIAGNNIVIHVIAVGTSITAMSVSGVGIFFEAAQIGPADTGWKSYTPTFTGLGTVTVNDFVYRVRGQNVEVEGQVVTGTLTTDEARMTLPMSGTVDYSQNSFSVAQPVGIVEQNASNALRKLTVLATDGDTYVNFSKQVDGSSSNPLVPDLASNTLASTTRFAIKFSVPLVELQNNYFLSATEAVSQSARVRYYLGASQSPTANTAFNLSTESALLAKKNSWSNSSGEITVPSPGDYKIQMSASFSSIAAAAEAYIAIGGTRSIDIDSIPSAALGTRGGADITITDPSTETISIRADQNITTLTTGDQNTWISITRISDRSGSRVGFPILGDITTGTTESGIVIKQSATADIGAAPSQTDFNNLLQKLRDAGILAT